ncbi:hypothetical protein [Prosthecobacter sp.]|uniref:hypothetical protein n=1 Tax=Prosthecobacter sp. TaxID=1965333 RepID=UPI0037847B28
MMKPEKCRDDFFMRTEAINNMKMKYYIATKLENHAKHNLLMHSLSMLGHECTYDWTKHGPVYSHGLLRVREVATLETQGVLDADMVIVLWPSGRGTHVELGIALGAGIPVHFISDVDGHHEATAETCAFYHHPLVTRHRTQMDFLEAITA